MFIRGMLIIVEAWYLPYVKKSVDHQPLQNTVSEAPTLLIYAASSVRSMGTYMNHPRLGIIYDKSQIRPYLHVPQKRETKTRLPKIFLLLHAQILSRMPRIKDACHQEKSNEPKRGSHLQFPSPVANQFPDKLSIYEMRYSTNTKRTPS